MLIKELYTNSQKYIPYRISFLTVSWFSAPSRPSFVPVCVSVLGLGLTDRSQPIRSSACSADAADVELVSQHPLKLNLGLFRIFGLMAPVPPGSTPRSRSSTCSTPHASTLPVGLSSHMTLVSSPVLAVLALLLLPSLPLGPRLI